VLVNQTVEKYKQVPVSETTAEQKFAVLNAKLQEQTRMIISLEESNHQLLIEISLLKAQMEHVSGAKSNLRRGMIELEEALQFANIEVAKVIGMVSPAIPVQTSTSPRF
jgi:hypothetical protein